MKYILTSFILGFSVLISGCSESKSEKTKEEKQAAQENAEGVDREFTIIGHTGENPEDYHFEPSEIVVKKGETVKLSLKSSNSVEHALWIPILDGPLNHGEQMVFTADRSGEFFGKCSTLCGTGHSLMAFKLIVED